MLGLLWIVTVSIWVVARKNDQFPIVFSIVLMFSFGSTLELEKHILKNVKSIFNV